MTKTLSWLSTESRALTAYRAGSAIDGHPSSPTDEAEYEAMLAQMTPEQRAALKALETEARVYSAQEAAQRRANTEEAP